MRLISYDKQGVAQLVCWLLPQQQVAGSSPGRIIFAIERMVAARESGTGPERLDENGNMRRYRKRKALVGNRSRERSTAT
jgi:hypothetical protein